MERVLKYHPGRRCTFLTPGAVVKAYRTDPVRVVQVLGGLKAAGLGGPAPPLAAPVVAADAELAVLALERLDGPTGQELILAGDGERAGFLAGTWLHAVSDRGPDLGRVYAPTDLVADAHSWSRRIVDAPGGRREVADACMAELTAAAPTLDAPVFGHGSFRATHVIDVGGGPGIVDWDSFRRSDPALDPGMFLAALARFALRRPDAARAAEVACRALQDAVATLVADDRLAWYRAGAIIKVSSWESRRREPGWPERVRCVLEDARRGLSVFR